MSSPVGGSGVAPGTSINQPTVVARLEASASSGLAAMVVSIRSIWKAPIWSVNAPFSLVAASACTNTPRVDAKPASFSSARAFLMAVLDWLAQLIGSLSIFEPPSSTSPSTGMITAMATSGSTAQRGRLPSLLTVASTQLGLASLVVGDLRSRAPMTVVGSTMPATSSATIPSERSTPKSCTIGTFEIFTTMKAMTAAMVAVSSGGPRWASVSPKGPLTWSMPRSSSIRFWIWIANSMPRPMRMGRPAMVTSDSLVPVNPKAPKPQATPTSIPASGSSRQRTLKATMRMTTITSTAMPPRVSMPPCR